MSTVANLGNKYIFFQISSEILNSVLKETCDVDGLSTFLIKILSISLSFSMEQILAFILICGYRVNTRAHEWSEV